MQVRIKSEDFLELENIFKMIERGGSEDLVLPVVKQESGLYEVSLDNGR